MNRRTGARPEPSPTERERALLDDSPVFCMAPWSHLHALPNGQLFPCCMSAHLHELAVGDLSQGDTLEQAWNAPAMRALRKNMLSGRKSALCERCYQQDDLGQDSFRTAVNQSMAHHVGLVAETDADGRVAHLNLPYLDIRFSNLCNYKCRICNADLSSRWHDDAIALGRKDPARPGLIQAGGDAETLWRQLEPLLPRVERIQFAGGEPLLMEEHYRILEVFLEREMLDVDLSYNTNLSVLKFRRWDVPALWSRFRSVFIMASLDGMGPRGDYMRKGQRWQDVVANRERMLAECPNVDFRVYPTVSLMNVFHIPDFFREWVDRAYVRPQDMTLNILFEPECYNVRNLTPELKREVTGLYTGFRDGYVAGLGAAGAHMRGQLDAVVSYMNAEDWDRRDELRDETERLDALRDERFAEVFPELRGLL